MTINEFIKELQKLKQNGKGDYDLLVNGCPKCNIETFDEYQEVVVWNIAE